MSSYNERLDKVLANLVNQIAANEQRLLNGNATRKATIDSDSHATTQAKQAFTSLTKELVAEAKPSYKTDTRGATQNPNNAFYHTKKAQGYNEAIEDFEQNLLKALEEK